MSGNEVLDLLAQLTRKSLVVADETADGSERFGMLETVRDYARHKLSTRGIVETSALRSRHADFYAAEVERLHPDPIGPPANETPEETAAAFTWADAEYHNIQSALAWWLDSNQLAPGLRLARMLNRFWQARGFDAEAHRWLTAFIELAERTSGEGSRKPSTTTGARTTITAPDHAAAVALLGMFASRRGDYVGARGRLTEAATIWRAIGNDTSLAVTLAILGLTEWLAGDLTGAVEHLEESRRLLQRCEDDPRAVGYAPVPLRNLGLIARHQGNYERAAEYFRESLVRARRAAAPSLTGYNLARALCHLGRTVYLQGDVAQAKRLFGEALEVMRATRLAGQPLADCLDWLAPVADAEGGRVAPRCRLGPRMRSGRPAARHGTRPSRLRMKRNLLR